MNKILLIDGNNLAHRARHRFIKFSNSEGVSSSIAYGGPFIVSSLLRKFPSQQVFVAFDGGRAKERMELLPGYKDREKTLDYDADNFQQQMVDFMTILMNLNINVVHKRGEEADDYIYALAKKYKKIHKTIVSADKDFVPMLDGYTKIWNPFKDKLIHLHNCKEIYGYEASEFLDYLILKGDKSDKIPGVTGLGDVRIRKLLDDFGSIDGYLASYALNEPWSQPWDKYHDAIEDAYDLNMELISLRYFYNKHRRGQDVPVTNLGYDPAEVNKIARKYGIRAFIKQNFLEPFRILGDARTSL